MTFDKKKSFCLIIMKLNTNTRKDGRAWKDDGPKKEAVHFNKYEEASTLGVEMRIKKTLRKIWEHFSD